jgi:hypothetical protein
MTDQKPRAGRPIKPASPGKRVSLGLKVTAEIKQRLDAAARANGRTQSQEAETRLERSFRDEQLLPALLELAVGRFNAGLLLLIGKVVQEIGLFAPLYIQPSEGTEMLHQDPGPFTDPSVFDQIVRAVNRILDAARPQGQVIPPTKDVATERATAALSAVASETSQGETEHWAKPVRELLGPVVSARLNPAGAGGDTRKARSEPRTARENRGGRTA